MGVHVRVVEERMEEGDEGGHRQRGAAPPAARTRPAPASGQARARSRSNATRADHHEERRAPPPPRRPTAPPRRSRHTAAAATSAANAATPAARVGRAHEERGSRRGGPRKKRASRQASAARRDARPRRRAPRPSRRRRPWGCRPRRARGRSGPAGRAASPRSISRTRQPRDGWTQRSTSRPPDSTDDLGGHGGETGQADARGQVARTRIETGSSSRDPSSAQRNMVSPLPVRPSRSHRSRKPRAKGASPAPTFTNRGCGPLQAGHEEPDSGQPTRARRGRSAGCGRRARGSDLSTLRRGPSRRWQLFGAAEFPMVALAFCQGGFGRCYPSSNAARATPTTSSASTADVFGAALTEASRRRWQWQYLENPASPGRRPEIWVAREDGRLLGPVRVHARPALVGRPRGALVLGHGRLRGRGGARPRPGRPALHRLERPRGGRPRPGPDAVLLRPFQEAPLP